MFLQLLKTGLTIIIPVKLILLLQQFSHWLCNPREVFNEPPIISRKSQETADITNGLGCLPFSHGGNLGWIHCYSFSLHNMSEESHFLQPKLAFDELGIQLVLP